MVPKITWAGFRHWRRTRPFWGGLLLLLAGVEEFASANQTLGDLQVHFGPQGFLSYLLPLLLALSGVLTWVTPPQRLFYGILGLLTAVYSLIGLNFGGFVLGMLLGIVGGALVLAWTPPRTVVAPPVSEQQHVPEKQPASEKQPAEPPVPSTPEIVPGLRGGVDETQEITVAPPKDTPVHRKALVLVFVPLAVTAAVLLAGSRVPASADEKCPEGMPSRSASATAARKSPTPKATSAKPATSSAAGTIGLPATTKSGATPRTSTSGSPVPGSSDDAEEGDADSGHPLVDGLNDLVDGVHDLLGGDDASPTPSAAPPVSPPASAGPSTSATPSSSASLPLPEPPSTPPGSTPPGFTPPGPTPGSAGPSPSASSDDIPCLGPRVFKQGSAEDVPMVAVEPSLLETDKLTLYNSTYDGVVDLQTAKGTMQALKFSMDKAVNTPFKLTIADPARHTLIESDELVTDGDVRFYTPKMEGKLFGLIPVTFTPQQPPPLTLPVLWFTDVRIDLAFIRCNTLTADPLQLSRKA